MDGRLVDLARARGGLLTVAEADRLGVSPGVLHRLARAGDLVHVRRGVYALAESWDAATDPDRYAMRTRAVLRTREGVAAGHHGALRLAGVPLDRVPEERSHVCDTTGTGQRVRTKGPLSVHPRPVRSRALLDALGDPYLDPASAVVLIARDDGAVAAAAALDQALRIRAVTVPDVERVLDTHDDRHGWVRQFRVLLADADPLSPAPAATRLRILLTDLGFRPRLRVPLRDSSGQFLTRPELLIGTSVAVVRDAYPPQVVDRLREVGVVLARIGPDESEHPELVAAAVAAALRELSALRTTRQAS